MDEKRERLLQLLRREAGGTERSPIRRASAGAGHGVLSFQQEALWLLDKVNAGQDAYRVSLLIRFDGRLDIDALQASLQALVARHEVLRTIYPERDGRPVAVVVDRPEIGLDVVSLRAPTDEECEASLDRLLRAEYALPFDLAAGPVVRAKLIDLGGDRFRLLLMIHHIAADGTSVAVLYRELCDIFAALKQGETAPLAEPELQYRDFAAWQRERLQGPLLEKQLAYWSDKLRGATALVPPIGRLAPEQSSFAAATAERVLPRPLSDALRALTRQHGVTLFAAMLAAFEMVLARYAEEEDVVIGTPVTMRTRPELESTIGLLVNMVALRVDLSGDPSFRECLRRVRQTLLEAHDHADAPFEKVVQAVRPARAGKSNPIFQAAFALDMAYQPLLAGGRELPGVTASLERRNDLVTHLDMEMYLRDMGGDIAVLCVCAKALYTAESVARILDHYVSVLDAVVRDPDLRVSDVDLLTARERDLLLDRWSRGAANDYARDRAFHELFEEWAARTPDATAVEFEDEKVAYAELNARSNRLARHLRRCGVEKESMVGVCLPRGVDLIVTVFAVLKAGGAYVPLDPNYPQSRLRYMVRDAAMRVIVTRGDLAGGLGDFAGTLVRLDRDAAEIDAEQAENLGRQVAADNLAYVIYTSGSTGRPKGVLLEHAGLCKVAAEQVKAFGVGPDSRVLQFSSPNFDASMFELAMALGNGGALVLERHEDLQPGPPLLDVLERRRITVLTIPPSSLGVVPLRPLPDLRVINVAGEACPESLVTRWADGRRFFNLYGPTECTIWTTMHECVPGEGSPPIGRPIGNTRVYVLDGRGRPVPVGAPGELCIGGVGVSRGYWNLPELTADRFVVDRFDREGGRLYRTGDKVRYREDGTLEFIGRIDRQVKVRGHRIELGEVESTLAAQPAVDAAVVVARPEPGSGPRLVAYVVPAPGHVLDVDGLRAAVQRQLPAYMVPAAFVPLAGLPLTPNGKVDYDALPDPGSERRVGAAYVAPRGALESAIAGVWKDVLGLEEVGTQDNFFDLGGHSLLLVRVHEKLKDLAGGNLRIAALFEFPTVRALAEHLAAAGGSAREAAPERKRTAHAADAAAPAYRMEPIAVVGMSARLPGARNIDEFWRNLRDGVESVRFFSKEELLAAGCDPALVSHPDYVPAKGYLEDADLFDADFFGYSPREAELIDPQQRLFLECAWEALEAAGYDPERFPGRIGVFAGSSLNTYQLQLSTDSGGFPLQGGLQGVIGNDKDFLPTRVSYKLDLRGPSVNVQTACSTSLVAVHQACRSLLGDECDMALAGGVSVSVPLIGGYLHEPGSITSPDGHCRAFDAEGAGILGGNGVGVVVLKRLSRALADGDTIRAVIRGSAINNDGALKVGYTAPSVEGQSRVIAEALRLSGVDASSIGYIEAHGTGTRLGDPVEIEALQRAFRERGPDAGIAIGSVKTNFGHLDAAAGVTGFIKAVLALEHRQLPPSLHFETPNPELHLERTSFRVNARLTDWAAGEGPRRAGVSSFGIGGTNAHVVLEEAPPQQAGGRGRPHQLLVLSARTPRALDRMAANLGARLRERPELDLADVAYTLQLGRKRFKHARAIVCRDVEDALAGLEQASTSVIGGIRSGNDRPVAFMFPGQGSQHVGMARGLYESEAVFRATIDECAEDIRGDLGADLRDVLYPPSGLDAAASERLTLTRFAQPALFAVEYALARLWMHWGIRPEAMIGHSVGEYVAACVAGAIERRDALRLVCVRARLMSGLPSGAMLAVPLPAAELGGWLDEHLSVAALNGPALTVVSGPRERVDAVRARLRQQGVDTRLLQTSHAFHSPMMAPILDEFAAHVAKVPLAAPRLPYVSNVTGDWITAEQAADPAYYARHLREAVQFSPGLERLFEHAEWSLLEVGPGRTLTTLAQRHPSKPSGVPVVASARHPDEDAADDAVILRALGQLWAAGSDPDWPALHGEGRRRRVSLPAYPFERRRYWAGSAKESAAVSALRRRDDIADWVYVPSWRRTPAAAADAGPAPGEKWLCFSDPDGPGAGIEDLLRSVGADVTSVAIGERFEKRAAGRYALNPGSAEDYVALLREHGTAAAATLRIAHTWLAAADDADAARPSDSLLRRGFFSLVYFAQALQHQGFDGRVELNVVTDRVHDVDGNERVSPEKAAVLGACTTLGLEYPSWRVRAIDLALERVGPAPARLAQTLVEELCGPSSEPVVAYRGRHRWVRAFERAPLAPPTGAAGPTRAGVYLITGGLGAVGLELAHHLARTVAARLVLVGRGEFPEPAAWDEWLRTHDGDRIVRKIRKLREIESAGGEVLLCRADVTDASALAAAAAAAEDRFGPLNGVIHAAGAEKRITPIESLDWATGEAQIRPKLHGLLALEQVLEGKALDFCAVVSSLASVMGVAGSAAYAAAHTIADAFVCRHNRDSDVPWIAINWDHWLTADADIEAGGDLHMRPREATELFARILARHREGQFLVSTTDLQPRIDHWTRPAAPVPADEAARNDSAHPRPALSVEYVEPRDAVETALAEIWRSVLGTDRIGVRDNFFELGGDSVLSIQIIARSARAGLKLTVKQIFQHQTIEALAKVAIPAVPPEPEPEHAAATGRVPLTPIQRWFFDRHGEYPHQFNLPTLLETTRPLDIGVLEGALQRLVAHHDALRLRFAADGAEWTQSLTDADGPLPVQRVDLAGLDAAEQDRRIGVLAAELQASLDVVAGPLLRAAYFDLGRQRRHRLLLVVHHLVVDVISWRILLEDLESLYDALAAGKAPSLPTKTMSIKRWSEALEDYAQTAAAEAELEHWLGLAGARVPALPVDDTSGANTAGSTAAIMSELEVPESRTLLTGVPRLLDASVNEALLLALVEAVTTATGGEEVLVDLEGHGREDLIAGLDPSRTVGWFTTLYPVLLRRPCRASMRAQLADLRAQLAAVPNRGFGFGILRYLSTKETVREAMRRVPVPQLSFLYLGQSDQASSAGALFVPTFDVPGAVRHPMGERAHLVEINCGVARGRFRISWTYSRNRHAPATIQALADAFMVALRALLERVPAGNEDAGSPAAGRAFTATGIGAADLAEILRQLDA